MTVVAVPWRPGCPHREAAWGYVHDHLSRHVERVVVCQSDPFTRSASRNLAFDSIDGDEVVILHDADMIAPPEAYTEMARLAADGRLVHGFHQYRPLTPAQTRRVLAGDNPWTQPAESTTDGWSVGGIIAIRADAWRSVGGMDSRFVGWCGEDFAFTHACSVILGPNLRLGTPAVHFWHPRNDDTHVPENVELMTRYLECRTAPDIRAVQEVR